MKKILLSHELFTSEELQAYEEQILDNMDLTEEAASKFFESFPKFLSVGGYTQLSKEVLLYRGDGHPVFRLDFVRRQFGQQLWDVVELKSPKEPFLVKSGNHWKLASKLEGAVHQALDYRDFLNEYNNRLETEKRTGFRIFNPKILLIGGRSSKEVEPEEVRKFSFRYNNIDIYTYEDLYEFAKENFRSNLIAIPILQSNPIDIPIFNDINFTFTFLQMADGLARPSLPLIIKNVMTGDSLKTYGLIDTGADCSAIPAHYAEILSCNLGFGKIKSVYTSTGIAKAYPYLIEIGIYNFRSGQTVWDELLLREVLEADFLEGICTVVLGTNFLSGFELRIDYANHLFSLSRK